MRQPLFNNSSGSGRQFGFSVQAMARWIRRIYDWQGNPWYLVRFPQGPMAELHHLAARHALIGRFGRTAWFVSLILTLAWPWRLLVQSLRLWRRYSAAAINESGRLRGTQLFDLIVLGIGYGLPPLAYYRYRLFRTENREQLAAYLFDHEAPALFRYLNDGVVDPAVEDKRLFAERCAGSGLPCVATLAWGDGTKIHSIDNDWPQGDVIAKPVSGARGEGVVLWRHSGEGYSVSGRNALPDQHALLAWVDAERGGKDWLVQRALENDPRIANLSLGPLVTIRVMTARSETGYIEVFAAVLKMPFGRRHISNHGIGSAIDLESGRLGIAFPYRPLHVGFERHPDTGGLIAGRILPDWHKTKQLAVAAHALFPAMRSLGWDVALTHEGPTLLETNSGWDVAMPQIALQAPLGKTAFFRLCGLV